MTQFILRKIHELFTSISASICLREFRCETACLRKQGIWGSLACIASFALLLQEALQNMLMVLLIRSDQRQNTRQLRIIRPMGAPAEQ